MEWYKPEDKKPVCYKTGNWVGSLSDIILVLTNNNEYHVCYCNEGNRNGRYFFNWIDSNTHVIINESDILEWAEIKR